MKICKECGLEKEFSEFHKDKKLKDGHFLVCKECRKKANVIEIITSKLCNKCNLQKNINEFYKAQSKDGRRTTCKECDEKYRIKYRLDNFEKVKLKDKNYRLNKPKKDKTIKKVKFSSKKEYFKFRRNNDILYKIKDNIGSSIRTIFRENGFIKKSRTFEILGCSYEVFKLYIESKFESWMNWNNHGSYTGVYNDTWQLDHITPLSSAKNEEEMLRLHHYSNYQPLCSKVNQLDKRAKLNYNI